MSKEVVASNFDKLYPEISSRLIDSDFIAIDAEFSGISSCPQRTNTLFDGASERYLTVRENVKQFAIIQFGITAFKYKRENKYVASSYVFYIFKSTPTISESDTHFTCQNNAVEFLSNCNFDFNKMFYEGINYLNLPEEKYMANFKPHQDLASMELKREVVKLCSDVSKWLEVAKKGSKFVLFEKMTPNNRILLYLVVKQLQATFPSVKVIKDSIGQVVIRAPGISARFSTGVQSELSFVDSEDFHQDCIGFSKVFKLLIKLKKPIVGHNALLDLMLMYNQFHEPLPASYQKFKGTMHAMFPTVYDTKLMSYEVRKQLRPDEGWESNELCQLYGYFAGGKGSRSVPFTPAVELAGADPKAPGFHEAGWDSYCTGVCFVGMMHYLAIRKYLDSNIQPHSLVVQQHLHAAKPFSNKVNIAQASVKYMCLDGPDPKSERPDSIFVCTKTKQPVDVDLLEKHLAEIQGQADIRVLSEWKVAIAISYHPAVKDLTAKFEEVPEWEVTLCNSLWQATWINKLAWTTASVGVCTLLFLTVKLLKKPGCFLWF